MDLVTYRDVEVPDSALIGTATVLIEEKLRKLVADPWQVWDERGNRLLAYGPWQVVRYERLAIKQMGLVRVMRTNVRRYSGALDKYPFGEVWDKGMGPPPNRDEHPTEEYNGRSVQSPVLIRSQAE